jgi:flavin reductase (DIM6/NTAB) family NADH-FMN oxidoreductase RutF
MQRMLIFTAEGPRSVDDRDVLHVYRGQTLNRFSEVTLVMANGEEVSGLVLVKALAALEARIADDAPPPMAA